MNALEKNLIGMAKAELEALDSAMRDESPLERAFCYQRICALVVLCHLPDSGLTSEGQEMLLEVENKANDLFSNGSPLESQKTH